MIVRVLAVLPLLALSTQVLASVATELAADDKRLAACTDKDPSTAGMNSCTDAARDDADKVLNRLYKTAVDQLKRTPPDGSAADDKEILRRLIASERAWIAYRDAQCQLQGTEMLNGSGEGSVIGGCLYEMTKERAKSLDEIFGEK